MSAPKLTPDLEALFQFERAQEPLPLGFAARLRARIDHSIMIGGPGGDGGPGDGGSGGDGGPGSAGPGNGGTSNGGGASGASPGDGGGASGASPGNGGDFAPSPGSAASSAASAASSALQSAAAPVASGLGALHAGALLGAFGIGIGVGAFGHSTFAEPQEVAVLSPREPVSAPQLVDPEPAPVVLPDPSVEIEVPPSPTPRQRASVATPSARADGRALLDQAQAALARGLAQEALEALDEHRQAFRRGPLREERQALKVQALAASGQTGRAQEEAAIFLARYPSSLFETSWSGPSVQLPKPTT